jgi:hypothetical protein
MAPDAFERANAIGDEVARARNSAAWTWRLTKALPTCTAGAKRGVRRLLHRSRAQPMTLLWNHRGNLAVEHVNGVMAKLQSRVMPA